MAFEAFLYQDRTRPRKSRRVTYTASIVFHAVVLVAFGIYSFWHVDELSPPTVTVTFMSAPPPPPPPPPPPKRKASTKPKTQPSEVTQPTANQIVAPREKEEPPPVEEEDEGVEGGVVGGVAGGVLGGVLAEQKAAPPPPPKMLPPTIGEMQLLPGEKDKLHLPDAFKRVGMTYVMMLKICVSQGGQVSGVTVIKSADPAIDRPTVDTIRTWRYKPFTVDGRPQPFCYVARIVFQTTN